jgi:hypothetical protein
MDSSIKARRASHAISPSSQPRAEDGNVALE